MPSTHKAAILEQKGDPLNVDERTTPSPGPNEILIQVKAVALNPVDYYQRDLGMPPVTYPAVVGSDVAGVVSKVGSTATAPKPGSRVLAFASSFYNGGNADYGAFQEFVLAREEGVIALPDTLSFEEGAILPLAALTAVSGWTTMGISLDTKYTPQEGVLIWGGASSVGSLTIQSAKSMGFSVYTTASPKHHTYLKTLGADAVFDYKAIDVVSQIIEAVKKDGVNLRTANCVVESSLQPVLDVLKATKGAADAVAKVAHTPMLPEGHPTLEGVEIKFNFPPMESEEARNKHIKKCFHGWLQNGLETNTVVPSPRVQVEAGGLEGLNKALDKLKAGVSATKIVVPI